LIFSNLIVRVLCGDLQLTKHVLNKCAMLCFRHVIWRIVVGVVFGNNWTPAYCVRSGSKTRV